MQEEDNSKEEYDDNDEDYDDEEYEKMLGRDDDDNLCFLRQANQKVNYLIFFSFFPL